MTIKITCYTAKNSQGKECIIGTIVFLSCGSNFNSNYCHDLIIICLNLSNIAITNVKWVDIAVVFITSANMKQFIC